MANSALLENEEMDWSVNYTLKLICAIIFAAVSLVLWIGYSTPNTINVAIIWMGSVKLNLILFQVPGSFIGWIIGLSISFLEYGSMLAFLWKRRWYFIAVMILTMFVSIYASYKFNQFSEQSNKMKEDNIGAHEGLVANYEKLIAAQDSIITGQKHYIYFTLQEQKRKYIAIQGFEPDWISFRERKALEAIDHANYLKRVYSDSLNKYTFKTIGVKEQTGYIVKLSDSEKGSSKGSLAGASIIEILIVFCGFVSIAFFNSSIQDSKRGLKNSVIKSAPVGVTVTESVSRNSVGGVTSHPSHPRLHQVTGNTQGNTFGTVTGNTSGSNSGNKKGDAIGFKIQGDNPNKLQQEIIEVYDEHKKRGMVDQLNISKLARHAGRSRKYVYTTLQAFTDFEARGKQN